MKLHRKLFALLLSAAMLLTLCSCSEKVKPVKINTKDYSREILLRSSGEGLEIIQSDKSSQKIQTGEPLKSDDSIRVGKGAELILDVDDDKQIYGQEESFLRLEASGTPDSGKTRICLGEGSVLVVLDEPLGEGELFEIQTDTITVSVPEGIARATKISEKNASYTLIEVFDGEAEVVVRRTGESASVKAGEAVLVDESGKKARFVPEDEIDPEFWKSGETSGLQVGKDGTGSVSLDIPYSKLPVPVLEQLLEYAGSGRELSVSDTTLANLIETGHDYVKTIVKEATCTEDGLVSLECALCGNRSEEIVKAVGHAEETIPEVEATCTQEGSTAGTRCTVCGEVLSSSEVIPALGHQEIEDEAADATCTQEGKTAGSHCAVCGETLIPQESVPALGHQTEETEDIAATCTEAGFVHEIRCKVCDAVVQEEAVIPALGHQIVELPAVAATCEKDGLTAGSECAVCGEVFEQQQTIPATGHSCKIISGRAPTCTRPGLTDGQRCTVCNKLVEAQKSIPMIEHTVTVVSGAAATCTQDGYTESKVCSVCGCVLAPAETIPALGHTASDIPAREATCAKIGLTEGSECSVCGEILVPQEEIPLLEHTPIATTGKEATCSSIGLTAGERCQVCGKILLRQNVIPKLEHTPKKVHGIYAMCFREGRTDGVVCAVCGYEIEPCEVIPALPHTVGGLARIAPTCTSVGWTEGIACRVCSKVLVAQEKIPMLPHTEGSTSKSYNPDTPLLNGNGDLVENQSCYSITHTCSVCGKEYKVDYVAHAPGAVSDEVDGEGHHWAVTRCADCGKVIGRKSVEE